MTLEELWELFSIIFTDHKEIWNKRYVEEQKRLTSILLSENIKISHAGSTVINCMWAKPIIDILVEILPSLPMDRVKGRKLYQIGMI